MVQIIKDTPLFFKIFYCIYFASLPLIILPQASLKKKIVYKYKNLEVPEKAKAIRDYRQYLENMRKVLRFTPVIAVMIPAIFYLSYLFGIFPFKGSFFFENVSNTVHTVIMIYLAEASKVMRFLIRRSTLKGLLSSYK